jgi:hypothetical protein
MMTDQLNLFEARAARDVAIAQVQVNAERFRPDFTTEAAEFIVRFLRENGPQSGEILTDWCREAGIVPHDDRAFGAVYMRLRRAGMIVKTGTCQRMKGHGTAGGTIWGLA